jgi:hypothetical protein
MLAVLLQGLPGLVVPSAAHTKTRVHAPRCAAVVMEEWDFAAQYAQQQAAQRAARQRRLEAEEAAKTGKPKAKAGFKGGVLQDEGKPTKLQYDAAVTRSWQSSDQPDFLPQEGTPEYDKQLELMGIGFDEGIRGSQHDGEDISAKEMQRNPEFLIEADPTLVFMPDSEDCDAECQLELYGQRDFVLPEPRFNPKTMTETNIDEEFEMFTTGGEPKTIVINVDPVAMAFEDYYCGFTADSHPAFFVSNNGFGKMERRNGAPTAVEVTADPQGAQGELVGYLCFIQPEEKDFSTYYKITCIAH